MSSKKILVFGKNGQLGWEMERTLAPLGEVHAFGHQELDLMNLDSLRQLIREIKPQAIVNASAYTAVDRAETESKLAMTVNAYAPAVMAEEAQALNAVLIHFSTDYVFDGKKGGAYTEDDLTTPLNVYGQSKLAGEHAIGQAGGAHIILRTSWVYSLRGDGFVSKVLSWSRRQETLKIVSDQIGSPTWARMLAEATAGMFSRGFPYLYDYFVERRGIYHLGGTGSVSRYDFAKAILHFDPRIGEQVCKNIEPALTADFPTPAERPLVTPLDCSRFERIFDLRLLHWEDGLRLAMSE
jgi:dTDP-4-dehydrorhamnose reductase